MKFFHISLICGLLAVLTAPSIEAKSKSYKGHKVFQLVPQTESQLDLIRSLQEASADDVDFWSMPGKLGRSVEVRVSPTMLPMFVELVKAARIPNNILVEDVQSTIEKAGQVECEYDVPVIGHFGRHSDMNTWMEEQCTNKPELASCGDVGTSTEGRTIKYIRLGANRGSQKKRIFVEANIHAREWLTSSSVLFIVNEMLTKYGQDNTVTRMMDTYDWFVIPMSNPDGYEYTCTERLWRKTRSENSGSFCKGTDPNRNWDFMWNTAQGGASGSPCSDTYRGSAPFSEPETAAIRDFVIANNVNTHLYLGVHSYSQYWLIPYGTRPYPEDFDELKRVADIGTKALEAVNNQRWKAGNIVDLLYVASGSSGDWAKGVENIDYSYTLELRPSTSLPGFVVSRDEIEPSAREVWAGVVAAVDAIPN